MNPVTKENQAKKKGSKRAPASVRPYDAVKNLITSGGLRPGSDLDEPLDAIFELYTALGRATQSESLSSAYRLTICAKLRVGRLSGARSETDMEWQGHVR